MRSQATIASISHRFVFISCFLCPIWPIFHPHTAWRALGMRRSAAISSMLLCRSYSSSQLSITDIFRSISSVSAMHRSSCFSSTDLRLSRAAFWRERSSSTGIFTVTESLKERFRFHRSAWYPEPEFIFQSFGSHDVQSRRPD